MKITFFFLFLIILQHCVFGQSIGHRDILQQPDSIIWSDYSSNDPKEMKRFLEFLHKDTSNNFFGSYVSFSFGESPLPFNTFALYHRPFIHFIDLDNDKDKDVIYDGRQMPGHESGDVIVFEKSDKDYIFRFEAFGTTQRIVRRPDKTWKLEVINYPCCSEFRFALNEYTFASTNGKMHTSMLHSTGFLWIGPESGLKVTKEFKEKVTAYSQNEVYLTTYPTNSEESPDFSKKFLEETFYTHYITRLLPGKPMEVKFKVKNGKDEEWFFVIADIKDAQSHIFIKEIGYDDVDTIGGWIKADNDLQLIESIRK